MRTGVRPGDSGSAFLLPLDIVVLPLHMCCFLCLQAAGLVLGHSCPDSMQPSSTVPHSSSVHIPDSPDRSWVAGLGVELSSTGCSWSPAGGPAETSVCWEGLWPGHLTQSPSVPDSWCIGGRYQEGLLEWGTCEV